MHGEALK